MIAKLEQLHISLSSVESQGVILLGRVGSGKTTALQVAAALVGHNCEATSPTPELIRVYPETHSMEELLGRWHTERSAGIEHQRLF